MIEKYKSIIEKIHSVFLSKPILLKTNNKNSAISLALSETKSDFEEVYSSGRLRNIKPTNAMIREVFFNNIDLSQFTELNLDQATDDLRLSIEIWENNRGKYSN